MEDLDVTPEEARAFNQGYLIGKHKPELLNSVLNNNPDNEYAQALNKGKRQADKEHLIRQQKGSQQRQQENKPKRKH